MPTLLLLHGWGQSVHTWDQLQAQLSTLPKWKIVAWDLPGFGKEPLVSREWGVIDYAQWVVQKIETEKLRDVVILGHSLGGRIASFIASQHPTWLNGVVLYAAPSLYRPTLKTKVLIKAAKVLKAIGVKKARHGNTELHEADANGLGQIFRNLVGFDQTAWLPKINVPTLLIWGSADDTVPLAIAQEMHQLIPESQLVVLDGLGHNAHLENPNLFYGTVAPFLNRF